MVAFSECAVHVKASIARERPSTAFLAKVYLVVQKRGAPNQPHPDVSSRTYQGNGSFHLTFLAAASEAQRSRIQGSAWVIEELPAVVVAGVRSAVIATVVDTAPRFGNGQGPGASLIEFAECWLGVSGVGVFVANVAEAQPTTNRSAISSQRATAVSFADTASSAVVFDCQLSVPEPRQRPPSVAAPLAASAVPDYTVPTQG